MITQQFDESAFWKVVKKVGKGLAKQAVTLWVVLKSPATHPAVKVAIVGALAYLVSPIDAVPDMLFPIGYADDAAVLTALIGTLGSQITKDVKDEADRILKGQRN